MIGQARGLVLLIPCCWLKSRILALGWTALVLVLAPAEARASLITFAFEGVVTFEGTPAPGGEVLPFSLGDSISGFYTFESTTPDQVPQDPGYGAHSDAVTGGAFNLAGYAFSLGGGSIGVYDPFFGQFDFYDVGARPPSGQIVNGFELNVFQLLLQDTTQTAFSSDALPLVPPDLSLFDVHFVNLAFVTTQGEVRYATPVFAELTSLSLREGVPVPAPATGGALVLGVLVALAGPRLLRGHAQARQHRV
jgi:hypothetical protein